MKDFEKRLDTLMAEAVEELRQIGIFPSEHILSITENSRARKKLGCCKMYRKDGYIAYKLEISTQLSGEDDRTVKEVILHELLHTCPGCQNHGEKWKQLSQRVNREYGYAISRVASADRFYLEREEDCRYKLICRNCGNVSYRIRKSKVVSRPENYRCSRCGGRIRVVDLRK